jgi:hypothetical protein
MGTRVTGANLDVPIGKYESDSDADEAYGSYSPYESDSGSEHEGNEA